MPFLVQKTTWYSSLVDLVTLLIVFIIILGVAYMTARWMGNFQANVSSKNNIHIIETSRIANNKFLQIVKVGNKYFLISVSKDSINYLCQLDDDDVNEVQINNKGSFKEIFSNIKNIKEKNETDDK